MATIVFARDLLPGRLKILFPSRGTLNIDQDFSTHELQDLQRLILFAVVDGRSADAKFTSHCGASLSLDQKLD